MSVPLIQPPLYTTVEAHGAKLRTFTCDAQAATLTPSGCASRWSAAQGKLSVEVAERLQACRGCAIGALHAGQPHVLTSPLYGAEICPRCDRGGLRLIRGRVCVSCYNREGEVRSGRNARGNAPQRARTLHMVRLALVVDNTVRQVTDDATALSEVVLRTIRNTKGGVSFAPAYRGAALQLELRFA